MFADTRRFIGSLSRSSRRILGELDANVLNECRYILMPWNSKFHWFLLVLDTLAGEFIYMNSLWSSQAEEIVKIFAKFISGYIKYSLRYHAPKEEVDCRYSRTESGLPFADYELLGRLRYLCCSVLSTPCDSILVPFPLAVKMRGKKTFPQAFTILLLLFDS